MSWDAEETKRRLLELLAADDYAPQRRRGLSRLLEIEDRDYAAFRALLRELKAAGEIVERKGGKFFLKLAAGSQRRENGRRKTPTGSTSTKRDSKKKSGRIREGRLSLTRSGNGFVSFDDDEEPAVFVSRRGLKDALNGDLVRVRLRHRPQSFGRRGRRRDGWKEDEERLCGRVATVLERGRPTLVGTFHRDARPGAGRREARRVAGLFAPDARTAAVPEFPVLVGDAGEAENGDLVTVELVPAGGDENNDGRDTARVLKVLGREGELQAEIASICELHELRTEFPEEVVKEAETVRRAALSAPGASVRVSPEERSRRVDRTAEVTLTIDPEDAEDYDDAVSFRRSEAGDPELLVHIADVAHYVLPGSALDTEARLRGTSAYLPGRVLPMLPEMLSNDVCSLREGVVRAVLGVVVTFGRDLKPKRVRLERALIRSRARLHYDQVREAVEKGRPELLSTAHGEVLLETLRAMRKFSARLREKRLVAGALDLDLPETRLLFNERGEIYGREAVEHHWVHQLIEEFMLAANKAVAEHLFTFEIPGLFRIHDDPDEGSLAKFAEFLREFGISLRPPFDRRKLSAVLQRTQGTKHGPAIHLALLTSLKQAVYSAEIRPHFALNASRYLHFTSPIRRYPDLVVHRALHDGFPPEASRLPERREETWPRRGDNTAYYAATAKLRPLAVHCSRRERAAAAAEEDVKKLRWILHLQRDEQAAREGKIVRMTRGGFFVELENDGIDGFVALRDLNDDYYDYFEGRQLFRGRRRGRCFQLGDKISVRIVRADPRRREINFLPV